MAEELAWLIKDNLPCKHLVLSAEESFVTFLDPEQRPSRGDVLMLEPMNAYHRMLLHRLADIFRLAHESIGEGDDRRLVLERCEDSCVPDVLVSDILECNKHDQPSVGSQNAPQLLKRSTDPSDALKFTQVQSPQMSFEERQAAYIAARERIFSEDLGRSSIEPTISRPRSVPVVARRMIAHALGKHTLTDQNSKAAPNSEPSIARELDSTCSGCGSGLDAEEELIEPTLVDATCPATLGSGVEDANLPEEPSKGLEYLHAKAAKRMFAQALGLGFSKSAYRVSNRQTERKTTDSTCLQQNESHIDVKEAYSPRPSDMLKGGDLSPIINPSLSLCDQSSQPALAKTAQLEQGKAAQRMLAQALGFRSLSVVAERSKSS